MSERPMEDRLRERARRGADPLLSDEARAATRREIGALAAAEARGRRRRAGLVLAAAAAVLLALVGPWRDGDSDWRPVPVQVALLDADGRSIESLPRSNRPFARPKTLLVELVSDEDAAVAIVLYDAFGERRPAERTVVVAGEDALYEVPLGDLLARDSGDSRVTVVVLASTAAPTRAGLEGALPERFAPPSDERAAAEAGLARELERVLGAHASVASFVLERR